MDGGSGVETRLKPGSLGRVRPPGARESAPLGDDEGDGRVAGPAGTTREAIRPLCHDLSGVDNTQLASRSPRGPRGPHGAFRQIPRLNIRVVMAAERERGREAERLQGPRINSALRNMITFFGVDQHMWVRPWVSYNAKWERCCSTW